MERDAGDSHIHQELCMIPTLFQHPSIGDGTRERAAGGDVIVQLKWDSGRAEQPAAHEFPPGGRVRRAIRLTPQLAAFLSVSVQLWPDVLTG